MVSKKNVLVQTILPYNKQYYSALPVPAVYPNLGLALFNPNPAQPVGGLFVGNALKTQKIKSVSI